MSAPALLIIFFPLSIDFGFSIQLCSFHLRDSSGKVQSPIIQVEASAHRLLLSSLFFILFYLVEYLAKQNWWSDESTDYSPFAIVLLLYTIFYFAGGLMPVLIFADKIYTGSGFCTFCFHQPLRFSSNRCNFYRV